MSTSLSKPPTRELDPPESWLPTQNNHRIRVTWKDKLWGEVDTKRTTTSMVWACFLTGLTSAVSFSVSGSSNDYITRAWLIVEIALVLN
jgi:hypothetical protein